MTINAVSGIPPAAVELVNAHKVQQGFDHLAAELQPLIGERDCVLLGVMNGGLFPLLQLMQRLHGNYLLDYCHVTRYGESIRGGATRWVQRPPKSVVGRTVIVIDDIYDEGCTLNEVADACRKAGATDVLTAVEVIKENPRRTNQKWPNYTTGITVPDVYVFGCGMDVAGRWRHLPAIYALQDEQAS